MLFYSIFTFFMLPIVSIKKKTTLKGTYIAHLLITYENNYER